MRSTYPTLPGLKRTAISPKLLALLPALCLQLLAFSTQAQTYLNPNTLSAPLAAGEYYHNSGITLSPGFSFTASAGQSLHLYITGNDCVPLATAPSANQNYIITSVPRIPSYNPGAGAYTSCDVVQTIQYLDGLGRPLQTVTVKGSPTLRDVVQSFAYDAFGRETIKYLPYTVLPSAASNGSYKPNAISDQTSFYTNPTNTSTWNASGVPKIPFPVAETGFELSPLNRIVEQGAPGDAWQLTGKAGTSNAGHTDKTEYQSNDASNISTGSGRWAKMYSVSIDGSGKPSLMDNGSYGPNQLYVTTTKDENWKASDGKIGTKEEYTDKEGHLVLKRLYNSAIDIISTYYVYDDFGDLTYILSPKAEPDNGNITQSVLDQLCFQYRYDERRRQVEKKIPGKGREYVVYDVLDQSVASQDSLLRLKNQWLFTKYDAIGRVVMSGIWNHNNTPIGRIDLQGQVNSQATNWESRDNNNALSYYYTAAAFPTSSVVTYLAVNYYDDYSIPNLPNGYDQHSSYSNMTKSLLTAALTNVIGTSTLLWSINYYDDKEHLTKKIAQNFYGGSYDLANYDETSFGYDFTDNVTDKTRLHHISGKPLLTIVNSYEFDHVGRETKISEQINGKTKVLLAQSDYNEVGLVKTKHLHSINNGGSFLQDISQQYNERAWLTKDSSGLFVMQLKYNDGSAPLYNGNITSQYWGISSTLDKNYTYTYDRLNRLTGGISNEGYNEQGIDYDKVGNLQHLTRINPQTSVTNSFTYNYNGNQLSTITGLTGAAAYLYDGNGNVQYDARNGTTNTYNYLNLPNTITGNGKNITYVYDAAGNKLRRLSVGGTGITEYIEGIQYDNNQLSFIQTDVGRVLPTGDDFNYEYNIGDKLGNARLSFDTYSGTAHTVQQDDYYPFGVEITRGSIVSPKNLYLYNKMELQEELGQYDYNKRFYDPIIGRFTSTDPLADKYPYYTPYQFAGNEVPNAMDIDGLEPKYQEKNGRDIIQRDGQLAKPLTNPDGIAYLKSQPVNGTSGEFAAVFSGVNPDGSKATGAQRMNAAMSIASDVAALIAAPEEKVAVEVIKDVKEAVIPNESVVIPGGKGSTVEPESAKVEPYNRSKHYGKTPTAADRKTFGATKDQVVDHDPPLVQRYHEGDPATGEKPGKLMTKEERKVSANDRSRMKLQPKKDSPRQGAEMSRYSRQKNKENGN